MDILFQFLIHISGQAPNFINILYMFVNKFMRPIRIMTFFNTWMSGEFNSLKLCYFETLLSMTTNNNDRLIFNFATTKLN